MFKQLFKVAVLAAGTAVVVPYAVAILTNVLCGWPQKDEKKAFKRALNPRKVYSLNYALLQQLLKVKYLGLKLRWMYFYAYANKKRLVKNISYGSHQNSLDLYFPLDGSGERLAEDSPAVVFLYGGTWSSGDKHMYGLLCSQLADKLRAVVCCPNYTLYPRGFVDDMVQDVVDCLKWIQHNAETYKINKSVTNVYAQNRIALIGHSAGGHLALLSVLELVRKGLIRNPQSLIMSQDEMNMIASQNLSRQSSSFSQSLRFEEGHFRVSESEEEEENRNDSCDASSNSFYIVGEKGLNVDSGGIGAEVQKSSDAFVMLEEGSAGSASDEGSFEIEKIDKSEDGTNAEEDKSPGADDTHGASQPEEAEQISEAHTEEVSRHIEPSQYESTQGETSQVVTSQGAMAEPDGSDHKVHQTSDPAHHAPTGPEIRVTDARSTEQPSVSSALSSIKLIIGLAGVYDITEHFKFETWRGIEDVSNMARAMYGSKHFDRFSPTQIIKDLPHKTRIPPVLFIHGSGDNVVPESSSHQCASALWEMGSRNVEYLVIPNCGHYEICLDIMDSKRDWYSVVVGELMRATNFYL